MKLKRRGRSEEDRRGMVLEANETDSQGQSGEVAPDAESSGTVRKLCLVDVATQKSLLPLWAQLLWAVAWKPALRKMGQGGSRGAECSRLSKKLGKVEMGEMHSGWTSRLKQRLCFRVKGRCGMLYADARKR